MKKLIASVTLITILFSFSITYAADNSGTASTRVAVEKTGDSSVTIASGAGAVTGSALILDVGREYKIAELQEIAVNHSRQAMVDDVDIKKKEMTVRTVRSDTNAMSDSILSITKPIDVKLELEAAQKTKQDHLNQLKVDVYKAAMNIQLCNKEIELQEQKLALAQEKLEMAAARFKAAMITQDDLDSAQYNVDNSMVNLTNTKEKLNSLYLELKKLLSQPLDTTPVKIEGTIKLEKFEDIDVDYALNQLYKTETSVHKAAGKRDIAQTAMDIAAKLYRKGDLIYDNCVLDLEETGLDLTSAKTALDVKVKNEYNDMVSRLDDVELANKYTELMEKKLANAKIRYEKGTISREVYMSAQESLISAEYDALAAVVDYNGARAEFRNMLGLE